MNYEFEASKIFVSIAHNPESDLNEEFLDVIVRRGAIKLVDAQVGRREFDQRVQLNALTAEEAAKLRAVVLQAWADIDKRTAGLDGAA